MAFKMVSCGCGLDGYATVAEAKEHITWKRENCGERAWGFIVCPRGELYHTWNTEKHTEDDFRYGIQSGKLARGVAIKKESIALAREQAGLPEKDPCKKKPFTSKDAADKFVIACQRVARKEIKEKGSTTWNQKSVYKCVDCNFWHCSSKTIETEREVELGIVGDIPVAQIYTKSDNTPEICSAVRIGQIRILAEDTATLIEILMRTQIDEEE